MHLRKHINMHSYVFPLFSPKDDLFYLPVFQQDKDDILKFGNFKRFSLRQGTGTHQGTGLYSGVVGAGRCSHPRLEGATGRSS